VAESDVMPEPSGGRLGPGPLATDPVIEAYKRDVDRSLLRESMTRSVDERLRSLIRRCTRLLRSCAVTVGDDCEALREHTVTVTVFGADTRILDLPTLIHVTRAAGELPQYTRRAPLVSPVASTEGPVT